MNKPKVVILCGGRGTRLREETELRPKPLVEIGGKPILWHIMNIYAHYGYKDFILCVGYKGNMIKEYLYHYRFLMNDFTITLGKRHRIDFYNNYDGPDWKVTVIDTGLNTLKGARIKKISGLINDKIFLMTYGDGVANVNIRELVNFHKKSGCIGTLTGVRPPSRFGDLIAKGGKVLTFTEKPQASGGLINGGFFVFNRKIFDYLSENEDCDFENGALEKLAQEKLLAVYEHKGSWECMDTLRDSVYLNDLWCNNKAFWRVWK